MGRYHRQKGHREFLEAAALVSQSYPQAVFVLCGDGVTWENQELSDLVDAYGLRSRVRLLGRCDDMPGLLPSFDIATSASICGEGFSNTVGEAMACGVPCVVTDVGDSALVVADTGIVVAPQDAGALAEGWQRLLAMGPDDRDKWSQRARVRIEEYFSLHAIIDQYQDLFCEGGGSVSPILPGERLRHGTDCCHRQFRRISDHLSRKTDGGFYCVRS